MTFRKNFYFLLILAAFSALLLAACGDSSSTSPAETSPTTSNATTTAITTSAAVTTAAAITNNTAPTNTINAATVATTAATATTSAATNAATTINATTAASGATNQAGSGSSSSGSAIACTKLNLNNLTEQQLTGTIPNFPNRMIREFLEYRPYTSILQFRKEIGKYVQAGQVTEWEKYVYVPVDPNKSDVETLKQIPGVSDIIANSLISARPFANTAAFMQALRAKVSGDQAASANCFMGA